MDMTDQVYVCSAGETFDSVSLALFRDEQYAAQLMQVNPKYVSKMVFQGGETLRIPSIEMDTDAYIPPWKR